MNEPPYGETLPLWIEKIAGRQCGGSQKAVFRHVAVPIEEASQLFLVKHGTKARGSPGALFFRAFAFPGPSGGDHVIPS